jgi:hypothetical protein
VQLCLNKREPESKRLNLARQFHARQLQRLRPKVDAEIARHLAHRRRRRRLWLRAGMDEYKIAHADQPAP